MTLKFLFVARFEPNLCPRLGLSFASALAARLADDLGAPIDGCLGA